MNLWMFLLACCLVALAADSWVAYRQLGRERGRCAELEDELGQAHEALARADQQLAPGPGSMLHRGELTAYGQQWLHQILAIAPRLSTAAAPNGRALADLLRTGTVASDVQLAGQVLVVLDYAIALGDACEAAGDADAFELIGDALAMAAVELTSLARVTGPQSP